jgi:signal transduction histidine kinase
VPHVFERFYRVDPSRERPSAQGGSGLGLAIAKSLVEAQGGAISLASEPGSGTSVIIHFPPAPRELATDATQASEPGGGAPSPAAASQRAQ